MTRGVLSPATGGAILSKELTHREYDLDLTTVAWALKEAGEIAARGDLGRLQQMLAVQARTLDMIYNNFAQRAGNAKGLDVCEKYLRLALKAQSQCRTTVESLAVIQQGPAIFARNANINNGQQQVNNGVHAPTAPAPSDRSIEAPVPGTPARMRARKKKVAHSAERTIGGRS